MYNNQSNTPTWRVQDLPTTKFEGQGVRGLTDTELLFLVLNPFPKSPEEGMLLARQILADNGGTLRGLRLMSKADWMSYKGVGEGVAIRVMSALELGARSVRERGAAPAVITSSLDSYHEFVKTGIGALHVEEFWVMFLNRANKVITVKKLSEGGTAGTVVDQKILFKMALEAGAHGIILAHNHPSQQPFPSQADLQLTEMAKNAGQLLGIVVLDHIIVANESGTYYSFADDSRM